MNQNTNATAAVPSLDVDELEDFRVNGCPTKEQLRDWVKNPRKLIVMVKGSDSKSWATTGLIGKYIKTWLLNIRRPEMHKLLFWGFVRDPNWKPPRSREFECVDELDYVDQGDMYCLAKKREPQTYPVRSIVAEIVAEQKAKDDAKKKSSTQI